MAALGDVRVELARARGEALAVRRRRRTRPRRRRRAGARPAAGRPRASAGAAARSSRRTAPSSTTTLARRSPYGAATGSCLAGRPSIQSSPSGRYGSRRKKPPTIRLLDAAAAAPDVEVLGPGEVDDRGPGRAARVPHGVDGGHVSVGEGLPPELVLDPVVHQSGQKTGTRSTATSAEECEQGEAELPVVGEAVAAGVHHHQVRRRRDRGQERGRRRDGDGHQDRLGRDVESAAAERATGITISAVAMLLISWPSMAVSTKRPSSSAYGPASPTTSTSASASVARPRRSRSSPSRARSCRRRGSRSSTRCRGRPARSSARQQDDRAGGEQARDRRRARRRWRAGRPSRRARRSRASRRARAARPAAHEPRLRRRRARPGRRGAASSAPHAPCSSSVSPTASSSSPRSRSSPLRCTASTTRSPLSVTMPGNDASRRSAPSAAGSRPRRRPSVRVKSAARGPRRARTGRRACARAR